jgi:hypothetical protein
MKKKSTLLGKLFPQQLILFRPKLQKEGLSKTLQIKAAQKACSVEVNLNVALWN